MASLQALDPTSPLRKRYLKLDATLQKPDTPGLADDFAKLGRVARECAGKLADAALAGAASAALTNGFAAVVDAEATAAAAVADIPDAGRRHKKSAAILRARPAGDGRPRRARPPARCDRVPPARTCRQEVCRHRRAAAKLAAAARRTSSWSVVLRDRSAELISVWTSRGSPPAVYAVGAADEQGPTFCAAVRRGSPAFRCPSPATSGGCRKCPARASGRWARTASSFATIPRRVGSTTSRPGGRDPLRPLGIRTDRRLDRGRRRQRPGAPPLGRCGVEAGRLPHRRQRLPVQDRRSAANDLYACGTEGLLMRWNGLVWTSIPSGTGTTLLTIAFGGPNNSIGIAVGEVFAAEIIERAPNGTWAPVVLPDGVPSVAGVSISEKGDAWASGYQATVLRRVDGNWDLVPGVPFGPADGVDLHTVSVDVEGGVWFAGGDIAHHGNGALLYYGPRALGSEASAVFPQATWTTVQPLLTETCAVVTCHGPPIAEAEMDLSTPALVATSLRRIPSTESRCCVSSRGDRRAAISGTSSRERRRASAAPACRCRRKVRSRPSRSTRSGRGFSKGRRPADRLRRLPAAG